VSRQSGLGHCAIPRTKISHEHEETDGTSKKRRAFIQLQDPADDEIVYTRAGNFDINANGQLVRGSARSGQLLEPAIQIPNDATYIMINADGQVMARLVGQTELSSVGNVELAQFDNPGGLLEVDENLFSEIRWSSNTRRFSASVDSRLFNDASSSLPKLASVDATASRKGEVDRCQLKADSKPLIVSFCQRPRTVPCSHGECAVRAQQCPRLKKETVT
jgi:hypothetical protein